MMLNHSLYLSKNTEWGTPAALFDAVHREFRFTLDACATAANAKCPTFLTEEDDALLQDWPGRVWLNPPYGRGIGEFVGKAYTQAAALVADVVVCLLPVRSDTRWWHQYCMRSSEIRFLTRRLEFAGSDNKAPFPACLVVFGPSGQELRVSGFTV